MNLNNKVSVIIPMYNAENFIERCIKSLIEQTYKNIEIVIVNDGSSDRSVEIVCKYIKIDNRIKLINKKNTGVSDSRNVGINNSTGEYVMFADCDDWYEKESVEILLNKMIEMNVDMIHTGYYRDNDSGITNRVGLDKSIKNKIYDGKDNNIELLKKLFKSEIKSYVFLLIIKFEKIKEIKFNKKISMMEDLLFYIELFTSIKNIYFYDECFYHYYLNYDSVSKSYKKYKNNILNVVQLNDEINKIMKSKKINLYDESSNMLLRYVERTLFNMYREYKVKKISIKSEYKEIFRNKKFLCFVKSVKYKSNNLCSNISVWLIKKNLFYFLKIFYWIRMFLAITKKRIINIRKHITIL